ncbi:phosphoribosylglycinamide formyltransferase [Propionibacterium sp.]|uniref:phosphoribosylglycinamide formyltransferase n=1 Tax=Propionibacterium sp. TaxID=1977903 RepID=UPI0039EB76B5
MTFRVVVLVSGAGTLLQALLDAERDGRLDADVVAVGSEIPDCPGMARARDAGVPAFAVPMPTLLRRGSAERLAWDEEFADAVAAYEPDLIVLAGFMKLFGEPFMNRFRGRIVNSHPALLPAFPGAHAVRDALAAGVTSTGATIFWVDDGVDSGTIITQHSVPVEPGDDEASLHERIKVTERDMLVRTVNSLAAGNAQSSDGKATDD